MVDEKGVIHPTRYRGKSAAGWSAGIPLLQR
jgi:hypothetical protein